MLLEEVIANKLIFSGTFSENHFSAKTICGAFCHLRKFAYLKTAWNSRFKKKLIDSCEKEKNWTHLRTDSFFEAQNSFPHRKT
jgi:hypothetical protein